MWLELFPKSEMGETGRCMYGLAADQDFAASQMKYFGTSMMKENIIVMLMAER